MLLDLELLVSQFIDLLDTLFDNSLRGIAIALLQLLDLLNETLAILGQLELNKSLLHIGNLIHQFLLVLIRRLLNLVSQLGFYGLNLASQRLNASCGLFAIGHYRLQGVALMLIKLSHLLLQHALR